MIPDRHIDKAGYLATYLATGSVTVRAGFPVILAATLTDQNLRECQEAAALADIIIGIAGGILGQSTYKQSATDPRAGLVPVTQLFTVVERAISGTGGTTAGKRQVVDVSGALGLIDAPAFSSTGATETFTPGVALDTVAVGDAFALAIMPYSFISA